MSWFSRKAKSKKAGSSTQACPLGNINVIITDKFSHEGISGVKIQISGPTSKSGKTNKQGLCAFKKLDPGTYTADVVLPKKFKKGHKVTTFAPTTTVAVSKTQQLEIQVSAQGDLKVTITDDKGAKILGNIIIDGPEAIAQQNVDGEKIFQEIAVGTYKVRANLAESKYVPAKPEKSVDVTQGSEATVELTAKRINVITPKIETKTDPIIFFPKSVESANDPSILEKQKKANPPHKIEIFANYTLSDESFNGKGKFIIRGKVLDIFSDEECTLPVTLESDGSFVVANNRLAHQLKTTFWVKGKAEGLAQIVFALDESTDDAIKIERQALKNINVQAGNFVQPKLETEYLVVPLERDLAKHRTQDNNGVNAEAVYCELSLIQSSTQYPYTNGAILEASPSNIEAYSDEACTNLVDLSQAIPSQSLDAKKPYQLWLKGVSKGKFELALKLETPAPERQVFDAPSSLKMSCVELELKVHGQDIEEIKKIEIDPDAGSIDDYHTALKDKDLPEQKLLTNEQKVKTGSLLHEQIYNKDGVNNHGRIKLILPKLVAADWPDNTDDYQIYLNRTNHSGKVKLFDSEVEGQEIKLPAGPFTVQSLKAAEKVIWVEGSSVTNGDAGVRLDVSLDRPERGLPKEVKRFADWAYFNIVKIKEVTLDYKDPTDGSPIAWDKNQKRFYINFQNDGNGDKVGEGRKVKIKASLSEELKDVNVYLMLVEDKDNRKTANWGVDLPNNTPAPGSGRVASGVQNWVWKDIDKSLKHKDKDNRKHLLHLSTKTNDKGVATVEVTLSQFAGDKFYFSAYIEPDVHLAKYIDNHTDLGKRKPVLSKEPIQLWNKFWYQLVTVSGINVADVKNAPNAYSEVKTVMEKGQDTVMPRATADAISPKVIYPKHMVSYYVNDARTAYINNYPGDTGDALIVGDDNKDDFFNLVTKKKKEPVAKPMVNVHALWIADGVSDELVIEFSAGFRLRDFPRNLPFSKKSLDKPLQGGNLLASGNFWTKKRVNGNWVPNKTGTFAPGDISLDPNRNSAYDVKINLPASIQGDRSNHKIRIKMKINGARSFLGTSYRNGIVNAYTPNDEQDYVNTINHELGHSLSQVSVATAASGRPINPNHAKGIPAHPLHYEDAGPHCDYQNKSCLMYESGPQPAALNKFCPICHPHVLVQDMSKM